MTDATPQAALLSDDEIERHFEINKSAPGRELRRLIGRSIEADVLAKLQATQAEPVQAGELPDERVAFEATVLKDNPRAVLTKSRNGCYQDDELQAMWWAWQARAALSARKPLTDETFVAACNGCPTPGKCKDTSGCASAGMNVPTYYVRHPDDTYTAADPQPRFNGIGLEVKP